VESVREAVNQAVRDRTRSRYASAVLLSGGLDSSSLTVVAREEAEREGRRLTAISSVAAPSFVAASPDEREFIELFRGLPNLDLELFDDPVPGPFDDLPEIIRLNETPLGTSRQYLYRGLGGIAKERGARILLDGAFGELGPSFNGRGGLAEQVRGGHWLAAAVEIRQRRKRRPQRLWPLVKGEVIRPLTPPRWLQVVGKGGLPAGMEPSRFAAFFREDFVADVLGKEVEILARTAHALVDLSPDHRLNQQRSIEFAMSSSGGLFPPAGVSLERPFLDRRILDVCLAAPLHLKCGAAGDRLLIRHAFGERLPQRVRWRHSKTPFAPDYAARYNRDRGKALDWIAGADSGVGGRLDLGRLRTALQAEMADSRGHSAGDFAAIYSITLAVRLTLFLNSFSRAWS
jgi:asparagine synthase (glutamine-hydrolysing)